MTVSILQDNSKLFKIKNTKRSGHSKLKMNKKIDQQELFIVIFENKHQFWWKPRNITVFLRNFWGNHVFKPCEVNVPCNEFGTKQKSYHEEF